MPTYIDTYVAEVQRLTHERADFGDVCLADRARPLGAQVWRWTRRDGDPSHALSVRLIVVVGDKDSTATVGHVRDALKAQPVAKPLRPLRMH